MAGMHEQLARDPVEPAAAPDDMDLVVSVGEATTRLDVATSTDPAVETEHKVASQPVAKLPAPPVGATDPLVVAASVAALGGRPADPASMEEHEDAVLAALDAASGGADFSRPHDDPDPARRAARRILQRLDGMGKWGGYHTEFAHLARGFAGNERALAEAVGEALLAAGLLAEKPSVGQRHVFLNPRRAGDIHALIERGEAPAELKLP